LHRCCWCTAQTRDGSLSARDCTPIGLPPGPGSSALPCAASCTRICCRPEAIRAFSESFAAFASDPGRPCPLEPHASLSGTGAALFEMLDSPEPPRGSEMRDLLGALPAARIENGIRIPLLCLAVCTGAAEIALHTARRLSAEDPGFRPAVYAEVAILRELGRREVAAARVAE